MAKNHCHLTQRKRVFPSRHSMDHIYYLSSKTEYLKALTFQSIDCRRSSWQPRPNRVVTRLPKHESSDNHFLICTYRRNVIGARHWIRARQSLFVLVLGYLLFLFYGLSSLLKETLNAYEGFTVGDADNSKIQYVCL